LQLAPALTSVSSPGSTAVLPAKALGHSGNQAGFVQLMLAQLTTSLQPIRTSAGESAGKATESRQEFSLTVGAPRAEVTTPGAAGAASSEEPPAASPCRMGSAAAVQNMDGKATSAQAAVLDPEKESPVPVAAISPRMFRGTAAARSHPAPGAQAGLCPVRIARTPTSAVPVTSEELPVSPSPAEPSGAGSMHADIPPSTVGASPAPAVIASLSATAEIAAGTGTVLEGKADGRPAAPSPGNLAGPLRRDVPHSLSVNSGTPSNEEHPPVQQPARIDVSSWHVAETATTVRTVTALNDGSSDTTGPAVGSGTTGGALLPHGLPATLSAAHTALRTPNTTDTGTGGAGTAMAHNAFERMDAAPAPQVLTSGPQRLAVGVRDAGLGWVEVRTHTAAGQISAVVATNSAEAHAAVSAQLPAMREYLAAQHVRVDTLGTQQFTSSSGQEDSSRGNHRGDRTVAREPSQSTGTDMQMAIPEAEEETLSYISVRV